MRCAACEAAMASHLLDECEVDVCEACGALWVDWFDGDLRTVTSGVLDAVDAPPRTGEGAAQERAPGACPRCRAALAREAVVVDGSAGAVDVWRCGQCFGVHTARAEAERLIALWRDEASDAGAELGDGSPLTRLSLRRLVAAIRAFLALRR